MTPLNRFLLPNPACQASTHRTDRRSLQPYRMLPRGKSLQWERQRGKDFALRRATGLYLPTRFHSRRSRLLRATVDVIGCPDELRLVMLKGKKKPKDIDRSFDELQMLLPKRTLFASSGNVRSTGSVITYTLSIPHGGSCVLYEGKFVGITPRIMTF